MLFLLLSSFLLSSALDCLPLVVMKITRRSIIFFSSFFDSLGINHHNNGDGSCGTFENIIFSNMAEEIFSPNNVPFIDACTARHSTIYQTSNGDFYSIGRQEFFQSSFGQTTSPTPVLIFTQQSLPKIFNSKNDIKLSCRDYNLFLTQKNSQNFLTIVGMGKNQFGKMGFGNYDVIDTPTFMLDHTKFFSANSYSVSLVVDFNDIIYISGRNINHHFGSDSFSRGLDRSNYENIYMADLNAVSLQYKIVYLFEEGVFVVFENEAMFYWGRKVYSLIDSAELHDSYILNPTRVSESIVGVDESIEEISCFDACYGIVKNKNSNKNKVYSWGYNTERGFGRVIHGWVAGRSVSSLDGLLTPKVINNGDIGSDENVISIATSDLSAFFVTDKNYVYAVGMNGFQFDPNEIKFGNGTNSPTRILTAITDYVKGNMYITKENKKHTAVLITRTPIDVITIVLITSFSVCIPICIIIIILIFVLLIFLYYKQIFSNKKDVNIKVSQTLLDSDNVDLMKDDENEVKAAEKHLLSLDINLKIFQVKKNDVNFVKKLGEGSFGQVMLATWYSKKIAVKLFQTRLFGDQHDFDEFEKEVKICSKLSHPNIISFYGCCLSPPRVMILMEFCENGDLRSYLLNNKKRGNLISLNNKLRLCLDIIAGLSYLHSNSIIHRDIKPQNILINKNLSAKIIDFGLSRVITTQFSQKTKCVGTSYFISPEVMLGKEYDTSTDIFSFGMILYILITDNFNPYEFHNSVTSIEIAVSLDPSLRPKFDEKALIKCSKKLIELCKRCWVHEKERRPLIDEIRSILNLEMKVKTSENDSQAL